MANCLIEENFINQELSSLGESVTVRTVTKDSYSNWGDATESTSDTTDVKCFVEVMSQEANEVESGIFKEGDIRFWFLGSQSISRGDRIQYDSKWYQVSNLLPTPISGTTLVKEVRVSKI